MAIGRKEPASQIKASHLMEIGSGCSTAPVTKTWRVVSNDPGTKMRIHVEQHADHRGMPMPLKLHFGEHQVDVLEVLDLAMAPPLRPSSLRASPPPAEPAWPVSLAASNDASASRPRWQRAMGS